MAGEKSNFDALYQYVQSEISFNSNDFKMQQILFKVLHLVDVCNASHEAHLLLARLQSKNELLMELNGKLDALHNNQLK